MNYCYLSVYSSFRLSFRPSSRSLISNQSSNSPDHSQLLVSFHSDSNTLSRTGSAKYYIDNESETGHISTLRIVCWTTQAVDQTSMKILNQANCTGQKMMCFGPTGSTVRLGLRSFHVAAVTLIEQDLYFSSSYFVYLH